MRSYECITNQFAHVLLTDTDVCIPSSSMEPQEYNTPPYVNDDKKVFQLHIGFCLIHLSQLTECPQAKLSEADKPETVTL